MYKIIYEDGSEYKVEKLYAYANMNQENWDNVNKPIRRFEYYLGGKTFILQNYEMYNHIIEYAYISAQKGQIITQITLMGLCGNTVTALVLNNKKKPPIEEYRAKLGQEYKGGLSTGWRKGTSDKSAGYSIS